MKPANELYKTDEKLSSILLFIRIFELIYAAVSKKTPPI
jgi:hypothetical protein